MQKANISIVEWIGLQFKKKNKSHKMKIMLRVIN